MKTGALTVHVHWSLAKMLVDSAKDMPQNAWYNITFGYEKISSEFFNLRKIYGYR
jgi:hypothetical protein